MRNNRRRYNNVKESIDNIDDLKKVYYGNPHIKRYIKPIDYSTSIKPIQPILPLNTGLNQRKIDKDKKNKMIRRNVIESQDIFFNDSNTSSSIEYITEYERMKQRQKFIEYQQDLIKQIEEKRRRIENEKLQEKYSNDNYRKKREQLKYNSHDDNIISSFNNDMLNNGADKRELNNEMIIKSEDAINRYPQMIKYFERMFHSLFQEQIYIINEYKNEVNLLKEELKIITNSNRQYNTEVNNCSHNMKYDNHSFNHHYDNKRDEEDKINLIKGALFKSKYEDIPLSSDSLPSKSKMVKKIGEKQLIESWINNTNRDSSNFNINETNKNHSFFQNENQQQVIDMIDSINDKICYPNFYIEEEKNPSIQPQENNSVQSQYLITTSQNENATSLPNKQIDNNELPLKTFDKNFKLSQNQIDELNNDDKKEYQKSSGDYQNKNNNNQIVIKHAHDGNIKTESESSYYNSNLPKIDFNQIIDFSKNDSSNIETDSENNVINNNRNSTSNIRNNNNDGFYSSKVIRKKDNFLTKLTYFDNVSQIFHEKIAISSKQIVNNEKINTTNQPFNTQLESNEKELFDHSLNTINEYIRKDNLKNTIESYNKEVLETSFFKDL